MRTYPEKEDRNFQLLYFKDGRKEVLRNALKKLQIGDMTRTSYVILTEQWLLKFPGLIYLLLCILQR